MMGWTMKQNILIWGHYERLVAVSVGLHDGADCETVIWDI